MVAQCDVPVEVKLRLFVTALDREILNGTQLRR
jgi:hypothetical protein